MDPESVDTLSSSLYSSLNSLTLPGPAIPGVYAVDSAAAGAPIDVRQVLEALLAQGKVLDALEVKADHVLSEAVKLSVKLQDMEDELAEAKEALREKAEAERLTGTESNSMGRGVKGHAEQCDSQLQQDADQRQVLLDQIMAALNPPVTSQSSSNEGAAPIWQSGPTRVIIGRKAIKRREDQSRVFEYLVKQAGDSADDSIWVHEDDLPSTVGASASLAIDSFLRDCADNQIETGRKMALLPEARMWWDERGKRREEPSPGEGSASQASRVV